jgi:cell division protein FtsI (penicillin-binding protein 3)
VLIQTDARRHAFSRIERPPTTGATIELTIDQYLQHVAERELRAGVEENRAAGGAAVVMDPRTGEILALANWPSFNPNAYRDSRPETQRNRAIQDLYEPGSTFKIVTASAAFEETVVGPDDLIDVSAGQIRFKGRVIYDDHNYGVLSFANVLVKSSNVGAIKVGLRLGPDRMGLYMKRFGFGRRTSPDFPGESPGIMWDPAKLNDSALASVSMGYQVGVTPLQMAAAVSSIANGGELFEPRVVRAVISEGARTPVPHKIIRQTVSPGTAATLTQIMEDVVNRGTGTRAAIPGFTVAGKTGTAQKVVNGQYSRSDYNASFVGFVPSRDPAFTIVVVIDSPHGKNLYYGGSVAAPVFQRIADAALRHRGIPPSINPAPPVLVARDDESQQRPTSGPTELPGIVTLAGGSSPMFPDLGGLGARDALRILARLGLTARVTGAGVVVDQVPEAGSAIERGAVATLRLDRQPRLDRQFPADAATEAATRRTP